MVGTRPSKTRADSSVGIILRQARLRRGLTIDQIAQELKIPAKQLKALEIGDLSVFAAEVYARGAFLKYTEYLEVQADTTQRAFLRVLSGAREYVPLRVHRPRPWLQSMITPRWILASGIAVIALVVGSYILWQVQSFLRLPALAIIEPTSNISPGATLTVRGQAATDAHVTVNEVPVLLNAEGNFEQALLLHPGINVLQVIATNAAGRQQIIERHLLMPRQLQPAS
ncbi:MAG: helix-turn-helix domain-containing protein [Candidatus Andersenbacteria bacterium]